jgi:hypothetical protein
MVIFSKSAKVIMSAEDILKLRPRRGIDVVLTPVSTNSNIYIATFSGVELNPSNPLEEIEESDLDKELAKLKIYSDRIRAPKEVDKIPKKPRQMAIYLGDPELDKNKYNKLRDKAGPPNANGMSTIQDD